MNMVFLNLPILDSYVEIRFTALKHHRRLFACHTMDSPLPGIAPLLESLTDHADNASPVRSTIGYLGLVCGPMFSGKTSLLASWWYKLHTIAHVPTLILNHASDVRFSNEQDICTHDGRAVPCTMVNRLEECEDLVEYVQSRCVLINEIQFFDSVEWVKRAVEEQGKTVICFGLDGDFQRRPFANNWVQHLCPLADTITKLSALCTQCKRRSAPFSLRLDSTNTQQVSVGGVESYAPRCRGCYARSQPE